jgi:hypothetical protein
VGLEKPIVFLFLPQYHILFADAVFTELAALLVEVFPGNFLVAVFTVAKLSQYLTLLYLSV